MVKVTWFELLMNLSATLLGVELFGPVGSAIALAITIVTMDIVWFPIVMRGRWGVPAGRFVISNGVLQSIVAGGLAVGLAILPILSTHGLLTHLALVAADVICVLLVGLAVLGGSGRSRLFSLARRGPTVGTDEVGPAVVA
jgi:hypothetical protein